LQVSTYFFSLTYLSQFSFAELFLENAKKNLVFRFGGGRHASFPQKPVVKRSKQFLKQNDFKLFLEVKE
jgi:hypothetical protein